MTATKFKQDLDITGNITLSGDITIGGNTVGGNANTDTVTLNADITSNIVPDADITYDLGTSVKTWREVFTSKINSKTGDDLDIHAGLDIALYPQGNIWISQGTKLIFEGTTPDDWEVKLQATSITADRDIVLPDASGTVAVSVSDTTTTTQGELNLDFTLSAAGNISATGTTYGISSSSSPVFAGLTIDGSSIVFEGSSADTYETTLTVTNPTADNTITLPDASGTVAVSVSDTTTTTQGDLSLDFTLSAAGNISATGSAYGISSSSSPTFAGLTINGSSIVFEGSSADANETTLTVTNPTADNTITLPDASGTVAISVSDTTTTTQGDLSLDFTLSAAGNISATGSAYGISASSSPTFLRVTLTSVPASSVGASGDKVGMIAADASYLYVCTANYTTGVADIWSRTAIAASTW